MNLRAYWRDPLALALLAILVLGLIATLRLAFDIGRPYGGFLEEYAPSVGDFVRVDTNTPLSWPNASSDLLNQALIDIDGQPYAEQQATAYAAAASRGAPTVSLTLENGGQRNVKQVPVRIFSLADYLDIKLPLIVTNVTLWVLAWIVFSSQPTDPLNRAASWVFGVLALALWSPFVSLFWEREPLVWTLNAISNLAWALLGAAVLAFAWRYPRPLRRVPAWAPNAAHAVGSLFGLAWAACRLWIYFFGWSPLVAALDGLAFTLSLPVMLSAAVLSFAARLVWGWFVERDRAVRRGLLIATVGLAIASPPIVLFLADMAGLRASLILSGLDLRYLVLAIPASYAFVILRYRTFRTAHPVFLGVVIFGLSALLSSVGSWALRHALDLPDRSLSESFIPVFVVSLIASFFWATQTGWQGIFSRLLQWERSSYVAARNFGERLMRPADLTSLPGLLSEALRSELRLERVAVWRWSGDHGLLLAGQAGTWAVLPPQLTLPPFAEPTHLAEVGLPPQRPMRLGGVSRALPAWLKPVAAAEAEVAVLLAGPSGPLGLLALGKRWDEEVFDERDLEIVTLIAQQATLVWMASATMAELREVPTLLTRAQKHERFRIAQDLHDTVQQRLGGIQLLLDTCLDQLRTNPQNAAPLLERCALETERTAQIVSRIRDNLAPPEVARGIAVSIAGTAAEFERRSGVPISVRVASTLAARLPIEAQGELVLVVQQALDNIAEHAGARHVTVAMDDEGRRATLLIEDDGCGFTDARRVTARAAGSFGLVSMHARMLGLGGDLRVDSTAGSGTRVTGWVPLRPASSV